MLDRPSRATSLPPSRCTSDEYEVFEQLEGSDFTVHELERFCFRGDRDKTLRSLALLRDEAAISITHRGEPVPDWQMQKWRREAAAAETQADLASVLVRLMQRR